MDENALTEMLTNTFEGRSFLKWVAKATEEYFKDPKVRERFEKWKKEREAENECQKEMQG